MKVPHSWKLMFLKHVSKNYTFSRCFSFVSVGCILLIILSFYEIDWIQGNRKCDARGLVVDVDTRPSYVLYGHDLDSGYLKHVIEMFESFGFRRSTLENENWDVLWAHDYPFRKLSGKLKHLKSHQKVNHFPGTGYITNKLDLATTDIKYIPKAFRMPKQKNEFLHYVSRNPDKTFVQKSNDHRGIKVEKIKNLDLMKDGTFIQEFIDNPLLVDGHKFDIGVYTIITSIEPLRVYIYNGDILFRFCPDQYYPFDSNNRNKYVIGDDYLPLWEVPSLKKYFADGSFTMRESFNAYMLSTDRNPDVIWKRIEDAIRTVILSKEEAIAKLLRNYVSKRNFFEMVRFDFAVDDDMNVYIMEANMSPNLSSAHYPPNRLLYYQVLFNLFSLVGLSNYGRHIKENMSVSLKNLMVHPNRCTGTECNSCLSPNCQLCAKCLSHEAIQYLKEAYVEYNNRHDCKRIFPPTMFNTSMDDPEISHYSPDNQLLYHWFKGKCVVDSYWC